jgi:hypothetical protein
MKRPVVRPEVSSARRADPAVPSVEVGEGELVLDGWPLAAAIVRGRDRTAEFAGRGVRFERGRHRATAPGLAHRDRQCVFEIRDGVLRLEECEGVLILNGVDCGSMARPRSPFWHPCPPAAGLCALFLLALWWLPWAF